MAEEKEEFKYGIKKEIIDERIVAYREISNRDIENENPVIALEVLAAEYQDLIEKENIATDDPERETKLAELKQKKEEILANVKDLEEKNKGILKANDVLDELEDLLKTSKEEYSFVELEEIEKRLEKYKTMLSKLDLSTLEKRKAELEEEVEKEKQELQKLKEEASKKENKTTAEVEEEYIEAEKDKKIEELKANISSREAMMVDPDRIAKMHPDRFSELDDWKKQLEEIENGKITDEIFDKAKEAEIKDLQEKIANRESMIAARGDELNSERFDELKDWKDRLIALQSSSRYKSEDEKRIDELEKSISDKEKEILEVNKSIEELGKRNSVDVANERRTLENRIEELEDLSKEKSLFRITDKGNIEICYPNIDVEIDEQAIADEYAFRRTDMLDKYYGNHYKATEYKERLQKFKSHIEDKEFEYVDENGKMQKGIYQTVASYDGIEEDMEFLQLEEYAKRLERLSKAKAGDSKAYANSKDPKQEMENDQNYIDTNNNAYNRIASTKKNLMTLGKYGEKVEYNKMREGEPVRNIVRAVGNAGKFIRNHTTAPINKFIGSKIVAPIYGAVAGANRGNVAGLYSNKFSHRYVARREYFNSQGKGFFSSRFNAIFNAKEGNKAILSAGAYDIKESIKTKYIDLAVKDARQKQIEFAGKGIDDQIKMLTEDMEKSNDPKAKEKFNETLKILEKAKVQLEKDKAEAEKIEIRQTRQTDAVDMDEHDKANKENVTRTITGVKMLTRFGIRKFVGPKLKEWLVDHTKKTQTRIENYTESETSQEWVPTTYKQEEVPVYDNITDHSGTNLQDIMSSNAGKQVEGYYSVYGGEAKPAMYELTGNEKITGVFQSIDGKGTGLSDTAGLTAPTLTDRVFDAGMLDANGVLKQDITLDKIIDALGADKVDSETLSGLYVSVGDRCWVKLSDLYKGATQQVQIGTELQNVVDVAGHMETVTNMVEKTREVTEIVENTRVTNALKGLGIALNITDGALLAEDIYENLRKTTTDVEKTKPQPRKYDYEAGYTGRKSDDYEADIESISIGKGKIKGKPILKADEIIVDEKKPEEKTTDDDER